MPEQIIRLDSTYRYSPAFEVVNAHISYDYENCEFAFRVNNLLDDEYSESGSKFTEFDPVTFAPTNFEAVFPSPERNFWLSAKYNF